jgi:hypothetical protein
MSNKYYQIVTSMNDIPVRLPDHLEKATFNITLVSGARLISSTDLSSKLRPRCLGVGDLFRTPFLCYDANTHSMLRLKTTSRMWKPVYSFSSFA